MIKTKICALIVTFNRKEYLEKLLDSLKVQTIKLDSIFIFDNYSSDGTDKFLKENKYIDEIIEEKLQEKSIDKVKYLYYKNNENSGGAGGFNKAFSIAKELDYNYIWVMDDDVMPKPNCLEELLKYQTDETMITIPNRIGKGFIDNVIIKMNLSNPLKIFVKRKTIIKADKLDESVKSVDIVDMPFEGPLINTKLIEKVRTSR